MSNRGDIQAEKPAEITPVDKNDLSEALNKKPQRRNVENSIQAQQPVQAAVVPKPAVASLTPRKRKRRCNFPNCRKKLSFTAIECRCGVKFCPAHRLPEDHECTFDFKNFDKNELEKKVEGCVADKVVRF
mmetsp:Transcript_6779/g.7417  ORF Transcript_6779/g.7417 Transcript_6779/m.7417 type:complete len:130 (+) Transcript_6779:93-482(+)